MPVSKPNLITTGASMPSMKRARDAAVNRSMAQNAALGLDNFARLLQNEPSGAQNFMPQAQSTAGASVGVARNNDLLQAAGFQNGELFLPGNDGINKLREMSAMQKAMQQSSQPLVTANGLRSLESARPRGSEGAVLGIKSATHKIKSAVKVTAESMIGSIGKLSSLFESGSNGIAAIGYDKVGGTSYGTYQIASNTGTFDDFLQYLEEHAPDFAKELRKAGEANTGSKDGAMPDAWRAISAREPEKFASLQHGFIEKKLYKVAAKNLGELGIDESKLSPVMREVLFSTSVQHGAGGAARIIGRAVGEADSAVLNAPDGMPGVDKAKAEESVIKRIYAIRQGQFSSSTPYVQKAVERRLNSELQVALNMLKTGDLG